MPANTIARLRSSAAAMTSSSRIELRFPRRDPGTMDRAHLTGADADAAVPVFWMPPLIIELLM